MKYKANKILFGEYPRFVGTPEQWPVFDDKSFELFVDANEGEKNCYSRISSVSRTGDYLLDKVYIDLDGDVPDKMTDTEMVSRLRSEKQFREDVLGDVVEDVRSIADFCFEKSIPTIAIYSGKGVHVHVLYESRTNPKKQLKSNTKWLKDKCDLDTLDLQVLGDVKRLCRVANCRRYDERTESSTPLYTVPLSRNEMRDITTKELVEWSKSPRDIEEPGDSRPPFLVRPEYSDNGNGPKDVSVEKQDVGVQVPEKEMTDKLELWLEEVLQMPCMYERIKTRNPAHHVRLNSAILLFNAGLTPSDVLEVYRRMGWHDFDQKVTRKNLEQIWKNGYRSASCSTLQSRGLCVYERGERSEECDVYGYKGGDKYW